MNRSWLTGQRLVVLFLFGCVFLNFPVLALLEGGRHLFGVPLLYVYLYGFWLFLILLIAFVVECDSGQRSRSPRK